MKESLGIDLSVISMPSKPNQTNKQKQGISKRGKEQEKKITNGFRKNREITGGNKNIQR